MAKAYHLYGISRGQRMNSPPHAKRYSKEQPEEGQHLQVIQVATVGRENKLITNRVIVNDSKGYHLIQACKKVASEIAL